MCLFLELAVEDATSKSECRSVLKLEYSTLTLNNCIFTPLALLNYFHTVYYIICKVLQCAAAAPQTATLHFSFTPLFNYFNIVNYCTLFLKVLECVSAAHQTANWHFAPEFIYYCTYIGAVLQCRSAAPQTALWGGPGPRFEPGTIKVRSLQEEVYLEYSGIDRNSLIRTCFL